VVRGSIDKPVLAKTLNLQPNQRIILAQSVGYPKKQENAHGKFVSLIHLPQ